MTRSKWVGLLVLALATSGFVHAARAQTTVKAPVSKAPVKLSADGELVVRIVSARTLPSGLGPKAVAELKSIAAKLESGDRDGALAAFRGFVKTNAKLLTGDGASRAALWTIRVGLLEPDVALAAAADKVRYAREAEEQTKAAIAALDAATQKAEGSGTAVTVSVVSVVPYAKFQPATKATTSSMTLSELKARNARLRAALKELQDAGAPEEELQLFIKQTVHAGEQVALITLMSKAFHDAAKSVLANIKA
ncbi:MAG: hypothetical protein HYV09_16260 [Deltaproteobacteria bacterium]|nr:hypothetical protein [Deltaproteobacteria bacterium]